jgi:predicted N-formylglutamate amidohydrolase
MRKNKEQHPTVSLTAANTDTTRTFADDSDDWPLIGPGDPPPYTVYNESGDAPFLLVCDHASRVFPKAMNQLGLADWVINKHVACDIGAADLTRCLADRFNAPAVLAGYSRLIVDLNRQLHDVSAFIPVSDGIAIPGNIGIDEREMQQRIRSFFNPYHEAVAQQLDAFRARGQVPAMISVHTCTPVFDRVVRKMHIGVMWDVDPRIAQPLIKNLASMDGVSVGDNEPYSGKHPNDFTVDYHAEQEGIPCVGLEVRQDLVSDYEGAAHWAGILAEALEPVMADTALYRLRQSD